MMLNPVIQQLVSRRSIRHFTGSPVEAKDLELIIQAGQQAPTSLNGQQISLIITHDKEVIKQIAELSGKQAQIACADVFITIVADFYRTSEAIQPHTHGFEQSTEGLITASIDAGIMLSALQTAANSLGYGSTAIGGIRNSPDQMIKLLQLPPKTFPMVGMTLGVADLHKYPGLKPRVPLASFAMPETYQPDVVKQGVLDYNRTLAQWWETQGLPHMPDYCSNIAKYYQGNEHRHLVESLKRQGFTLKDAST